MTAGDDRADQPHKPRHDSHPSRAQDRLWAEALNLGALVEATLTQSVEALCEQNPELAAGVKATEREIDRFEVGIEKDCLRILALYEPMASDLRRVVAILRINRDLERIGDMAERIAKRVKRIARRPDPPPLSETLELLARGALAAFRAALDALVAVDAQRGSTVIDGDHVLNRYRRTLIAGLKESIQRDPTRIDVWLWLIDIVRDLERIGDHAAGIAESVIYLQEGKIVRHGARRADAPDIPRSTARDDG